eukprot:CAMPEP_0168573388 /NCGR_PEP_ID=MMETSP0413-20121227/18503_1 /TAXON_ID=136452 /ORGANISM="Filamoeba nolandi, Strain NC-AS-23-1" /LENGTH=745 /DNA_ID=CAMNT_0008606625 /DNA_START=90 /DNA_END=2324 /DNA_ORIENTATION=-
MHKAIALLVLLLSAVFAQDVDPASIKYVHMISMNHLDIGFDGLGYEVVGYAINIINKYFDEYFPKAIQVAQNLRAKGGVERLVYTTHPWLVAVYLDCENSNIPVLDEIGVPLHCPNQTMIDQFKEAVHRGDITWHAFPFNAQAELMDIPLFETSIQMAKDLDASFGRNTTITMSQRDVPGTTRAVIPLLRKHGIQALTVGVNAATAPPAYPSAFVWLDPATKTDIIGMYHPGGYGGIAISDCVMVPGLDRALAFAFRTDNAGPPDEDEVIQNFATVQSEFPNAVVIASDYDSFVRHLMTVKDQLPIYIQETGDTWIHGVPSDPLKVSMYRAVLRSIQICKNQGLCDFRTQSEKLMWNRFARLFIKNAEHTWGLDVKTFLDDWENWSNEQFESVKQNDNYQLLVNAWVEQRDYVYNAIQILGSHPLSTIIKEEINQLKPRKPNLTSYNKVTDLSQVFRCGNVDVSFDGTSGAITYLHDRYTGRTFAQGPGSVDNFGLGQFVYQSYSQEDFENFFGNYLNCDWKTDCSWAEGDFGKQNVSSAEPESKVWLPTKSTVYLSRSSAGSNQCSFIVEMAMDSESYTKYGAPQLIYNTIEIKPFYIPEGQDENVNFKIDFTLQIFNKTSTRLPEALWFSFRPAPQADWQWQYHKLGQLINMYDIAFNGSHHMHGVDTGVYYSNSFMDMQFNTLDAPIAVIGEPNAFPSPLNTFPDAKKGLNYNLYNNLWGTNYIMWYPYLDEDGDSLFRFSI